MERRRMKMEDDDGGDGEERRLARRSRVAAPRGCVSLCWMTAELDRQSCLSVRVWREHVRTPRFHQVVSSAFSTGFWQLGDAEAQRVFNKRTSFGEAVSSLQIGEDAETWAKVRRSKAWRLISCGTDTAGVVKEEERASKEQRAPPLLYCLRGWKVLCPQSGKVISSSPDRITSDYLFTSNS